MSNQIENSARGTVFSLRLLFFIALAIVFLQCGCKNSPVEPPIKDPREYTWTVDTLAYPGSFQTLMEDIWASSPTDVYAVGHNDGAFGKMYHYDGRQWKPVDLAFGAISLAAIYGFSAQNIIVVGSRLYLNRTPPPNILDSALIIQFDGKSWREMQRITAREVRSVWGRSPSDVYAGTADGKVLHFNGQTWTVENLPVEFQVLAVCGDQTKLFATGVSAIGGLSDSAYMLLNEGAGWRILDRQHEYDIGVARFGWSCLYSPGENIFYGATWGISQWENGSWYRILYSATALVGMNGSAADNIFVVGGRIVYHWNGNDWKQLDILTGIVPNGVTLTGVWTDGREAFLVGHDGAITYVLHGK